MTDLSELLDTLLSTGDALLAALADGEIEEAGLLTARRGSLVAHLPAGGAAGVAPEQASALAAQERALAAALAQAQRRLDEAIEAQGQRRQAAAAYHVADPTVSQMHAVRG